MRIFLTGATGYIGKELARVLAARGHEVRALVRPAGEIRGLSEAGVSCFVGDVTDRYSLREGMSGCEWVVHAAAVLDFAASPERLREVNVGGSENVASLAWKLGVGRLLALSTIAVFGGSPADGAAATEDSAVLEPLPSLYAATKRDGDLAIAAWRERGLKVNTVYPSLVYGPPGKRGGVNSLLRMVAKGRMPALVAGDRMTTWVHVADLVDGLVRVMETAPAGESYVMAGDARRIGDVVRETARLAGTPPPRWRLPVGAARVIAGATRPYFRLRGRRSPFLPEQLESLARHWHFDDSKARRDLGWKPRTLDEGLPQAIDFLKA